MSQEDVEPSLQGCRWHCCMTLLQGTGMLMLLPLRAPLIAYMRGRGRGHNQTVILRLEDIYEMSVPLLGLLTCISYS